LHLVIRDGKSPVKRREKVIREEYGYKSRKGTTIVIAPGDKRRQVASGGGRRIRGDKRL